MNRIDDISARNIMKHVSRIVSLGPRADGSAGSIKAATYVAEYLQKCGCLVEKFPIEFPVANYLECSLRKAGNSNSIPCLANTRSAFTNGPITREATFLDLGLEEDYRNRDIKNKLVFASEKYYWQGNNLAATKYYRAVRKGAAAFIFSDKRKDDAITCWTMSPGVTEIPTISIPYGYYKKLKSESRNTILKFTLNIAGSVGKSKDYIISGKLPGKNLDSIIVDGSHHETVASCPGANDNASGIAVMLELARFLSKTELNKTVIFLSTCGEECACYGIDKYLAARKKHSKMAKASLVIDQIAGGNAGILSKGIKYDVQNDLVPTRQCFASDENLVKALRRSASRLGYYLPVYDKPGGGFGESGSFILNGIPSVFLCGWNTDLAYHTAFDTIDKISSNGLKAFADIIADSILNDLGD